MRTVLATIAMLGLLVHTSAFGAACSPNSCSGQISTLVAEADGNVYVAMVGGLGGLTSCTPDAGDQPFLTLPAASANLKLIYATLLAAQMTGRPVTIHVAANSQGCTIRYVTSP